MRTDRGGTGAKVEIRAGSLQQKLETYAATPAPAPADILFGLGPRDSADAVRVLWPSGVLQTELVTPPAPGASPAARAAVAVVIKELDRKPSSYPFLYAWNGRRFEFVTDFMGGGEMGHWEGPGVGQRVSVSSRKGLKAGILAGARQGELSPPPGST